MSAAALDNGALVLASERDDTRLSLRLAARRESLEPARLAVLDFLAPANLSADTVFHLELVLEEVLMNIVWHAYPPDRPGTMALHVSLLPEAVALRFTDSGFAFDPLTAPPPRQAATLAEATPGGQGLALLRRFTRLLTYERAGSDNVLYAEVARA